MQNLDANAMHRGILAVVLDAKLSDNTLIKQYTSHEEALDGFNKMCNTLSAIRFDECNAINLPNRNTFRFFEKKNWHFLLCVTVEANLVVATLTDKVQMLQKFNLSI